MIAAALLLATAAAANTDAHVVRVAPDGTVVALRARSELGGRESAWIWSPTTPPTRVVGPDLAVAPAQTRNIIVQVVGPAHKPEARASIRWGSEAMLRELPDVLLPEAIGDANGSAVIIAPVDTPLFARVAGPRLASGWKGISSSSRVVLHALPSADLRIRLVDRQGHPASSGRVEVRGADVTAQPALPMWGFALDGRVGVPGVPAAEAVELVAWSDALAPALLTTRASAAPQSLVLDPGAFFGATVIDEAKKPLAGVDARIVFPLPIRGQRIMTRTGRTDDEGHLRIGGLPPGESHWSFSREGYAGVLGAGELPLPGRNLGALVMRRGRELTVTVLDGDGKPLAGAAVRMLDGSGRATSGERGVAVLQHVSGGFVQAVVSAKGFRPAQLDIPDAIRKPLQVSLVRGASVRARMAGTDGQPLTGGGKVMMELDGARSSLDLDGDLLELDGLAAGKLRLEVRPAGRAPLRLPERKIALGERVDLGTLRFAAGLTLRGTVVDDTTGAPVPGATLRVLRPNTFSTAVSLVLGDTVTAESGETGEFALSGLSPGIYTLAAEAPGFARTFRTDVQLREEPETDLGTVKLAPARTLAIHCTPVDKCGTEVRLLLAGAQNDWAAVDAPLVEGRATLLPVAPGAATLRLIDGREIVAEKEVSVASDRERTELEIDLGSASVSGLVTRGGAPVSGGSLTFLSGSQAPRRIVQVSQTGESGAFSPRIVGDLPRQVAVSVDGSGRFLTTDLSAGEYNVTYVDANGQSAPRRVTVTAAAQSTLQLDWPAGQVRGYVHLADGSPAGGAMITVRDAGGQAPLAMASVDGTFTISGLETGSAEISASKGKTRARQTVSVGDPGQEYVELTLEEAHDRAFTVTVVDGRGLPVSNAFVFFHRREGLLTASTDVNGSAEVTLREGDAIGDLAAFAPARGWSFQSGAGGESAALRFGDQSGALVVRASSGALACEALAPTGFPITQALAILGGSITATAGRPLEIGGLPPGTYTVVGRGAGSKSIDVRNRQLATVEF